MFQIILTGAEFKCPNLKVPQKSLPQPHTTGMDIRDNRHKLFMSLIAMVDRGRNLKSQNPDNNLFSLLGFDSPKQTHTSNATKLDLK